MHLHPILSALLRSKTGALLVIAQIALTLAIVCNALFVVKVRLATASRPSGLDEPDLFQIAYVGTHELGDRAAMIDGDLAIIRAIPGVAAVSPVNSFPLARSGWSMGLSVHPEQIGSEVSGAAYFGGEDLVRTFGLRVVEGRDFTAADVQILDERTGDLAPDTMIMARALARRMFPDGSAVGQTVYLGSGADAHPMRVIGIVDTLMSPGAGVSAAAYQSFLMPVRYLSNGAHYAIRAEPGQRDRVMAETEKALSAVRRDRVMVAHSSMDEIRERRYRGERTGANMLIAVVVGLIVVTASGIVGITSLWVNQRKKQIGIRRALGARKRDIIQYFLGENLIITTTGIVVGIGLAIGLNQYLVAHVELARLPLGYVGADVLVMWALGVIAVLGPAWRASSVPPAVATRTA